LVSVAAAVEVSTLATAPHTGGARRAAQIVLSGSYPVGRASSSWPEEYFGWRHYMAVVFTAEGGVLTHTDKNTGLVTTITDTVFNIGLTNPQLSTRQVKGVVQVNATLQTTITITLS
jgi:hypothetical protein